MGKAARQANREFRAVKDKVSKALEFSDNLNTCGRVLANTCLAQRESLGLTGDLLNQVDTSATYRKIEGLVADGRDIEFSMAMNDELAFRAMMRWGRNDYHVVFDLDQDMLDALLDSEMPEELPDGLLDTLPYKTFAVTGFEVVRANHHNPSYRSFIYGDRGDGEAEITMLCPHVDEPAWVTWVIDAKASGKVLPDPIYHDYWHDPVLLAKVATAIVLYLASPEPDIESVVPEKYRHSQWRKGAGTLPDTYRVGWHVGAALRRAREGHGGEYGTSGKRVRPHMRKAHWHLYWTGVGRSVPQMRWVAPVAVNADLGAPVDTVRAVVG